MALEASQSAGRFEDMTPDKITTLSAEDRLQLKRTAQGVIIMMDNLLYQDRLGLVDNNMAATAYGIIPSMVEISAELNLNFPPEVRRICAELGIELPTRS